MSIYHRGENAAYSVDVEMTETLGQGAVAMKTWRHPDPGRPCVVKFELTRRGYPTTADEHFAIVLHDIRNGHIQVLQMKNHDEKFPFNAYEAKALIDAAAAPKSELFALNIGELYTDFDARKMILDRLGETSIVALYTNEAFPVSPLKLWEQEYPNPFIVDGAEMHGKHWEARRNIISQQMLPTDGKPDLPHAEWARQDHLTPAAREWFKTNLFMTKEEFDTPFEGKPTTRWPRRSQLWYNLGNLLRPGTIERRLKRYLQLRNIKKTLPGGGVDVVTRRCTTIVYDLIHKQRHPGPSEKAILKWCEMKLAKAHSDAYRDELQAACSFLGKPQKMTITDLVSPAVSKALEAVVEKNWIIIPYKGALVNVARADNPIELHRTIMQSTGWSIQCAWDPVGAMTVDCYVDDSCIKMANDVEVAISAAASDTESSGKIAACFQINSADEAVLLYNAMRRGTADRSFLKCSLLYKAVEMADIRDTYDTIIGMPLKRAISRDVMCNPEAFEAAVKEINQDLSNTNRVEIRLELGSYDTDTFNFGVDLRFKFFMDMSRPNSWSRDCNAAVVRALDGYAVIKENPLQEWERDPLPEIQIQDGNTYGFQGPFTEMVDRVEVQQAIGATGRHYALLKCRIILTKPQYVTLRTGGAP